MAKVQKFNKYDLLGQIKILEERILMLEKGMDVVCKALKTNQEVISKIGSVLIDGINDQILNFPGGFNV
jgi:hypothetical protein